MKTEIKTEQYWINKKSKLIWSVQQSENDIIIYRNNQTKIITRESLLKNFTKKYEDEIDGFFIKHKQITKK